MPRAPALTLTQAQFDLIARLLRAGGLSRTGCQLILVEQLRPCDAARRLNMSPTVLMASVKRYKQVYGAIQATFCAAPTLGCDCICNRPMP